MKQWERLFNTIVVLLILIICFVYFKVETKAEKPLEIGDEINIETWYKYKGEYLIDIEKLQIEKQEIIDNMNFEQTIAFYNSGIYENLDIITEQRLQEIDNLIETLSWEMAQITDPKYITQKKLGL
jgi:hypothetical protein